MKRAYVSWGSTTSGQKKTETRAKKNRSGKQWKNKRFLARDAGQKKPKLQKTYGFLKTFKMLGKMKVSGLQSRQRARAIHGGFKPAMRNCTGIPPKTLEFLMFPGGPRRGNDVNPGTPLLIHGKSYGFLKSFKILGKTSFPAGRTGSTQWRPKEAPSPRCKTAMGSYPKTLGFPYVS